MQDFTSVDLESLGVAKPYSMEAEQSVLGAALLESESVLPELVESLRPEMFYVRQNGEIFSEMVRLFTAGERVDLVTLLDAVVVRLPVAWLLAFSLSVGFPGIYLGQALSPILPALVGFICFKSRVWEKKTLLHEPSRNDRRNK